MHMKRFFLNLVFIGFVFQAHSQHSFDPTKLVKDLNFISSDAMQGRKTGTAGIKKAEDFIIQQLKETSVQPFVEGYIQPFVISGQITGKNILAVIPGKKKETIVVSAHYDHVGMKGEEIFNGADDNASGVAALLAMIPYFQKNLPDHRIIFAFFDAEEIGLKGSAHFTSAIDLQKENIVLNINLDMVSRSDKNELYACGGFHNPKTKAVLEKIKVEGCTLRFGHDDPSMKRNDWTAQSDHYNFHVKKIPFVYFGVEDHADYHRSTDDFNKINPVFYSNSVETILQSVKALDKELQ